ncbi:unnamed protein product [Lymnaea stagnalis]|uniref:Protein FAM32A n=1 Tax=Lymnaea stagnalis TaxID=6523 RepID=A0AAV2HSM3_LYMST
MDDYETVQTGGLKLKGVSSHAITHSWRTPSTYKKKDKDKKKMEEMVKTIKDQEEQITRPTKTKAEIAFERAKKKKNEQQILERAAKSHKERIMEFNQQLDNLTEHFDIPKVSWTK